MLSPKTGSGTICHLDRHGQMGLSASHVPVLRQLVGDLVEGYPCEVSEHEVSDRAQTLQSGADGGTDDRLL